MRNLLLILAVLGFIAALGCNREQKLIEGTRRLPLGAEFLSVVHESGLELEESDSNPYWYYASYVSWKLHTISLGGRHIVVRGVGVGGTETEDPKESQLEYITFSTPNSSKDDAEQLYEDLVVHVRHTYTVKAESTSPMRTSLSDRDGNTIVIQLRMLGDDVWSVTVSIEASVKTLEAKRKAMKEIPE